jgi:hypothetical protein
MCITPFVALILLVVIVECTLLLTKPTANTKRDKISVQNISTHQLVKKNVHINCVNVKVNLLVICQVTKPTVNVKVNLLVICQVTKPTVNVK